MAEKTSSFVPVPIKATARGRVRNIGKPKHWYMALAEAIKNAMDSIEASGRVGRINVLIERRRNVGSELGLMDPVENVVVTDNGTGFIEQNAESFRTQDSLLKLDRGGKGLGRFVCLQFFEQVFVSSVYQSNDCWERREFRLRPRKFFSVNSSAIKLRLGFGFPC
jgi:hypothetical protein